MFSNLQLAINLNDEFNFISFSRNYSLGNIENVSNILDLKGSISTSKLSFSKSAKFFTICVYLKISMN